MPPLSALGCTRLPVEGRSPVLRGLLVQPTDAGPTRITSPRAGGCQCDAVRFEISGPPTVVKLGSLDDTSWAGAQHPFLDPQRAVLGADPQDRDTLGDPARNARLDEPV